MNVTYSPRPPWTEQDDLKLKRGKRTGIGPAEIARTLKREEASVRRRAIALGIAWVNE